MISVFCAVLVSLMFALGTTAPVWSVTVPDNVPPANADTNCMESRKTAIAAPPKIVLKMRLFIFVTIGAEPQGVIADDFLDRRASSGLAARG